MVFYDVISERTVTSVLNNYKLSRSNSHIDSCVALLVVTERDIPMGVTYLLRALQWESGQAYSLPMHMVSEAGQGQSRVDDHFACGKYKYMYCKC